MTILSHQAVAEKHIKQQHQNLAEANAKLDESTRTLNDYDAAKKKLAVENADLLRQLEEADNQITMLAKVKFNLSSQLDECKKITEEESKVGALYHGTFVYCQYACWSPPCICH